MDQIETKNGILLVDKEQGWTSSDVVCISRGILKTKVGHAGTLDPMATGLLILLVGSFTKKQNEFLTLPKTYEAKAKLAIKTDTWDAEGEVLKEDAVPQISEDKLQEVIKSLTGKFNHIIPPFSAKKVGGQKMYKLAREGVKIEKKESEITVFNWSNVKLSKNILKFKVEVSSGTYVRSLAVMLAKKLGTHAHLTSLRRTTIGKYDISDAIKVSDVKKISRKDLEVRVI